MNSKLNKRAIVAIALFLTAPILLAQKTELEATPFEVFNEFTNYGINFSPRMQFKATTNRTSGAIDFDQKNSFGYGMGLFYVLRPAHQFSYRFGVNINKINEEKYSLPKPLENEFINTISTFVLAVSMPLEVEYKKPISENIFFSLRGGLDVTFIGDFSASSSVNNQLTVEYATSNTTIYPNLRLSPGVYFNLGKVMLQTSVVYQKMIPNFIDGTYKIENVPNQLNTEGTYKMSGDYIGLDLNFQFKKRNKN